MFLRPIQYWQVAYIVQQYKKTELLKVFNENYRSIVGQLRGNFYIDSTVGRAAKIRMDFISDKISDVTIKFPDSSVRTFSPIASSPFIQTFDFLEVSASKLFWSQAVGREEGAQ